MFSTLILIPIPIPMPILTLIIPFLIIPTTHLVPFMDNGLPTSKLLLTIMA